MIENLSPIWAVYARIYSPVPIPDYRFSRPVMAPTAPSNVTFLDVLDDLSVPLPFRAFATPTNSTTTATPTLFAWTLPDIHES